jgi:hypothetical protein
LSFVIDASVIVGLAFGEAPHTKTAAAVDALAAREALTPGFFAIGASQPQSGPPVQAPATAVRLAVR